MARSTWVTLIAAGVLVGGVLFAAGIYVRFFKPPGSDHSPAATVVEAGGGNGDPSAEALLQAGEVERAEALLRKQLAAAPDDLPTRVNLAAVLAEDGRLDEAAALAEQAPQATHTVWMFIGDVRLHQARQGRNTVVRRGVSTTSPSSDPEADDEFKRRHLQSAARAFTKALESAGEDDAEEPRVKFAVVQELLEDYAAAAECWKKLAGRAPQNPRYAVSLARCATRLHGEDAGAEAWRETLRIAPRTVEALIALGKYHRDKGETAEADDYENRAKFYDRLPPFARLEFSVENQELLAALNTQATIDRLLADPSLAAAEMLAILCWSHPHNALESSAFEELEKRGTETLPLVQHLLDHAHSTCTIKQSAAILGRAKVPGLFERLAPILPRDLRGFGFDMDIAGALAELGDARAVPLLIAVLNPGNRDSNQEDRMLDRDGARARAALALSSFTVAAADEALQNGFKNPRVQVACGTALYRKTEDAKYLQPLRTQVEQNQLDLAGIACVGWLRQHTELAEGSKLVKASDERLETKFPAPPRSAR